MDFLFQTLTTKFPAMTFWVAIIAFIGVSIREGRNLWRFIRGPQLVVYANQWALLRLSSEIRLMLAMQMLADDITEEVSVVGREILMTNTELRDLARLGRRDLVMAMLPNVLADRPLHYDPPQSLIEKYFGHELFFVAFYIPLSIHNQGTRPCYICSLVLLLKNKNDHSRKWAYTAFSELESSRILGSKPETSDLDLAKGSFAGVALGAGECRRVDPLFLPIKEANNQIFSRENLVPGDYLCCVFGYDSQNRELLKLSLGEIKISKDNLIKMFSGGTALNYLTVDKALTDAYEKW